MINIIITFGIYLGVVLAAPFVLYQVWLFIAPGLYKHERKAVTGFLFLLDFPVSGRNFLRLFRDAAVHAEFPDRISGAVQAADQHQRIFRFHSDRAAGLGVIFELPVLIFFLALFNIVTPKFLWKNLRYAILIIAVVAAIVTPTPDATTMLVFMAPMVGLYFIGIGVAALVVRNKAKRRP